MYIYDYLYNPGQHFNCRCMQSVLNGCSTIGANDVHYPHSESSNTSGINKECILYDIIRN